MALCLFVYMYINLDNFFDLIVIPHLLNISSAGHSEYGFTRLLLLFIAHAFYVNNLLSKMNGYTYRGSVSTIL